MNLLLTESWRHFSISLSNLQWVYPSLQTNELVFPTLSREKPVLATCQSVLDWLQLGTDWLQELDYLQLIDKITAKIKSTSVRHLSYAGQLQIINSVLFSLHNSWGSVFILPQSIFKQVDKQCREYLWVSTDEKKKVSLVAWEQVCLPRKYGGLNVKNCRLWNLASIGKLLWLLVRKKDMLWVKWVHGVYMRNNSDVWEHTPPAECSWYWKKLHKV